MKVQVREMGRHKSLIFTMCSNVGKVQRKTDAIAVKDGPVMRSRMKSSECCEFLSSVSRQSQIHVAAFRFELLVPIQSGIS